MSGASFFASQTLAVYMLVELTSPLLRTIQQDTSYTEFSNNVISAVSKFIAQAARLVSRIGLA